MVKLFYTHYISVDVVHHKIFHAKVGKGGIKLLCVFELILYIPVKKFSILSERFLD